MRSYRYRRVVTWVLLMLGSGWMLSGAARYGGPPTPPGIMQLGARDVAITIRPNGDVAVVEHWLVHVERNPVPYLFFGIYSAQCEGITLGAISYGEDQRTEQTNAPGYTVTRIEWNYQRLIDGDLIFDIPYTVHAGIGLNEHQAWLDWHLFGKDNIFAQTNSMNAAYPSDSSFASSITLTFPAAMAASDLYVTTAYPGQTLQVNNLNNRTVQIRATKLDVNNFLEIEAVFPRTQLISSLPRPAWQTTNVPPMLPTAIITAASEVDAWTWLVLGGLALVFILFCVLLFPFQVPRRRRGFPSGYPLKIMPLFRKTQRLAVIITSKSKHDKTQAQFAHHRHASTARVRHKRHTE